MARDPRSTFHRRSSEEDLQCKKYSIDSIWSDEVEDAFKAALEMIPKAGLKKNRICDVALGRNQYISMYIEELTGEKRTAKQISSHIQTIYRNNKDKRLVDLIKNGAPNTEENHRRFYDVFSSIMKHSNNTENQYKRRKSTQISSPQMRRMQELDEDEYKRRKSTQVTLSQMREMQKINDEQLLEQEKVCLIKFEEPSRLSTTLHGTILTHERISRFPNLLVNIQSIKQMMHASIGIQIRDLPNIPVPVIYRHSRIHIPTSNSLRRVSSFGNDIECIFDDFKGLQLGVLTMVYDENIKVMEDFEFIDGKIHRLNIVEKFWGSKSESTTLTAKLMADVSNVTFEQYIVSVKSNGQNNVCVEQIQSIIISDFDYSLNINECSTHLRICMGFDFDINLTNPIGFSDNNNNNDYNTINATSNEEFPSTPSSIFGAKTTESSANTDSYFYNSWQQRLSSYSQQDSNYKLQGNIGYISEASQRPVKLPSLDSFTEIYKQENSMPPPVPYEDDLLYYT